MTIRTTEDNAKSLRTELITQLNEILKILNEEHDKFLRNNSKATINFGEPITKIEDCVATLEEEIDLATWNRSAGKAATNEVVTALNKFIPEMEKHYKNSKPNEPTLSHLFRENLTKKIARLVDFLNKNFGLSLPKTEHGKPLTPLKQMMEEKTKSLEEKNSSIPQNQAKNLRRPKGQGNS